MKGVRDAVASTPVPARETKEAPKDTERGPQDTHQGVEHVKTETTAAAWRSGEHIQENHRECSGGGNTKHERMETQGPPTELRKGNQPREVTPGDKHCMAPRG